MKKLFIGVIMGFILGSIISVHSIIIRFDKGDKEIVNTIYSDIIELKNKINNSNLSYIDKIDFFGDLQLIKIGINYLEKTRN